MRKYIFLVVFHFSVFSIYAQQNINQLRAKIKEYNTGYAKARIGKNLKNQEIYLSKLAYLYWNNKIYPDAIRSFGQLLPIETALGNRIGMIDVHKNLGIIYRDIHKNKQSLAEFRLALPIANQIGNQQIVFELLNHTATVLGFSGRFRDAIGELEKALWSAQAMKNTKLQQDTYMRISKYYKAMGNTEKAMEYYQYFAGVLNLEQNKQIELKKVENTNQAKVLERVKDSLHATEDSLKKAELINQQRKMEINLLSKQKQIESLKLKERDTQLENEIFRRNMILIFLVVLIAMGVFLFRDYRKIRQLNTLLASQKQEITGQNIRLELSQKKLLEAQTIIQEQNIKLQSYNRDLEKQVEERTHDLQKAYNELLLINNDLDTLTYRASHDLKSPVASLEGLCNVAIMEIKPTNPANFYFNQIKSISANMASLLDSLARLRDIKHTNIKITEIPVKAVVENIIENEAKSQALGVGINFMVTVDKDISVKTDADLFRLILNNIIHNAVHFSLPASKTHIPEILISATENEKQTEIKITDNGEGISKEIAPKIFNMFYRGSTNSKGAGLGLYTCKSAIDKIGGLIEYSENEAEETVFTIRLFKDEIISTSKESIPDGKGLGFNVLS